MDSHWALTELQRNKQTNNQKNRRTLTNDGDVAEPVAVVQLLMQRVMNFAFISMAGKLCFGEIKKNCTHRRCAIEFVVVYVLCAPVCASSLFMSLCVCVNVVREFTWKVPLTQKKERKKKQFVVRVNFFRGCKPVVT